MRGYDRFLQRELLPEKREDIGLEALFREIFPIVSYDKTMELEYLGYELEKPRYTIEQCRELRLTYGYPLKVALPPETQEQSRISPSRRSTWAKSR